MPTEISAGRVLGRSLSLLFSNAGAFLMMVVLIHLPLILFRIYLTTDAASEAMKANGEAVLLSASLFLQPLATAAVTYGVLRQLAGKPATFAECVSVGLSRMFLVFLVGLVTGLITMTGLIFGCVLGILAMVVLFVVTPAAVVERLGVIDALRRSHALTKGSWWPLLGVVAFNLSLLLGVLGTLIFKYTDWSKTPPVPPTGRTYLLLETAATLVITTLQTISNAVAYHDLRAREGGESRDILATFE